MKVQLADMMVHPVYPTLQIGKESLNAVRRYAEIAFIANILILRVVNLTVRGGGFRELPPDGRRRVHGDPGGLPASGPPRDARGLRLSLFLNRGSGLDVRVKTLTYQPSTFKTTARATADPSLLSG
jgi:hypothetical protein